MSSNANSPEDWAHDISAAEYSRRGVLRQMRISLTDDDFWQLVGHELLEGQVEVQTARYYSGIGFASRPGAGHEAIGVVGFPSGPNNSVILAARDPVAHRAAAAGLGEGETAVFSCNDDDQVALYLRNDGTLEARTVAGASSQLATLADLQALANFVQGMTMPVSGSTAGPTVLVVPTPAGTQVFRAE